MPNPTRRQFLYTAGALSIVRLAGAAPKASDKLTVACIGVGSQGLRLMMDPNQPFQPSRPELGPSATAAETAHYMEWINACHGGPPASANYSFEQPIVESLMLGNIAIRAQELLEWNTTDFRLTRGSARASTLLMPQYRAPWSA